VNLFLILSDKIIIKKSAIYFYFICLISLIISFFLGWINPVMNSWYRLFMFFLMFNIIGPIFNNSFSISFRHILFKCLLLSLPIIFLFDCFYILYLRKITLAGHVEGFLESPNLTGVISALNILLFLIYFLNSNKTYKKLFYLFFIIICIPILLSSASRAAILSLTACLFFLFFLNTKKISLLILLFLLIGFFSFNYLEPFYKILIDKIDTRTNSGDITAGRSTMYLDNLSDFKKNPITGVGFYNMYNINNSKINDDGSLEYPSGWLFIFSSTGILGFIYFLFALRLYIINFFRIYNLKNNLFNFLLITFLIVHSNFEGYIYSGGGLLFCIFWLSISNFNKSFLNENTSNISRR
jgi:O-antigen ligase